MRSGPLWVGKGFLPHANFYLSIDLLATLEDSNETARVGVGPFFRIPATGFVVEGAGVEAAVVEDMMWKQCS